MTNLTSDMTGSNLRAAGFVPVPAGGQTNYVLDNTIFDVQNGASLNLTGSSDTVVMESGSTDLTLTGNGNTVIGSSASGVNLRLDGAGNVVSLGDDASVMMVGSCVDATLTIGANGSLITFAQGGTINATAGGDYLELSYEETGSGDNWLFENKTVNANNDTIDISSFAGQINGNGNKITIYENVTLDLEGSNNLISFDSRQGSQSIETSSGYYVTEDANGHVQFNASSLTVANGIATVGLGNGNVVTISNVSASGELGATQATQLVTAMASYAIAGDGVSSTNLTQTTTGSPLLCASVH